MVFFSRARSHPWILKFTIRIVRIAGIKVIQKVVFSKYFFLYLNKAALCSPIIMCTSPVRGTSSKTFFCPIIQAMVDGACKIKSESRFFSVSFQKRRLSADTNKKCLFSASCSRYALRSRSRSLSRSLSRSRHASRTRRLCTSSWSNGFHLQIAPELSLEEQEDNKQPSPSCDPRKVSVISCIVNILVFMQTKTHSLKTTVVRS